MGTFTNKVTAIGRIITCKSATLLTQRQLGEAPDSLAFGRGDIKDMVLVSRAMKISYDGFLDAINQIAADQGGLHALQELRDALDELETKENDA